MTATSTNSASLHDLIARRRSVKSFAAKAVDDATLRVLLEAARWAPSSFNEQPWMFILARRDSEGEQHEKMLSCLSPHNRVWARHAPVLLLAMAKWYFEDSGRYNRHAAHDLGLAMGNLELQATASRLRIHQMGGFDPEKARALFGIPDHCEPFTISAIGYENEQAAAESLGLPDPPGRRRKPLSGILFQSVIPGEDESP